MSARPDQVFHEILARGFRAYPRGIANGFVFAVLAAAYVWLGLPHEFLVAWLVASLAVGVARLRLSRAFLRAPPPPEELDKWARYAAIGYGGTGLLWGILGAAAIHYAPEAREYILTIGFLIVLFPVLAMQSSAGHPNVFRAFVFCAMAPIILVSALEPVPPGGNYYLRLGLELMILAVTLAVGRSGNRLVAESIVMRHENLELVRELTRQKEELDKANLAKTRFLAAASHDLRQPMQAVVLLVENLRERAHEPAVRRVVESISTSVGAMSALLNEILDISKFDAGIVKPQRSVFPVASVLDRLRSAFAYPAAQHDLAFRVRPCTAVVETDPILLYRILVNLTNNALRYTRKGGVLVGCRRRPEGLWIEVWDTGIGIPGDKYEDVFREFHQLANAQRDRDQGLGLGLAIVERTARLLGHPLKIASRVGRGSLFALQVPYGDPSAVRASERSRAADALDGCTVLVVDDEDEIRAAMTLLLEQWGCRVVSASSAAQVDSVLAALGSAPDVILCDYRLAGEENGVQVILGLRARFPDVGAVIISGDIGPEVLRETQQAGFHVMHKPLRPARLRSLLGSIWRERQSRGVAKAAPEAAWDDT
jgi:signal transduction histidine kinase